MEKWLKFTKQLIIIGFIILFSIFFLDFWGFSQISLSEDAPGNTREKPAETNVILDGQKLFSIDSPAGSFSPELRAVYVSQNIQEFAKNYNLNVEDIKIIRTGDYLDIIIGDKILNSVTPEDANKTGIMQQKLAEQHLQIIQQTVQKYRVDNSLSTFLFSCLKFILLTAFSIYFYVWLKSDLRHKIYKKLFQKLEQIINNIIPSIEQQTLLSKIINFIGSLFYSLLLITLNWLLFISYGILALKIFPKTKDISKKIISIIENEFNFIGNKIVDYLPDLFMILFIGSIGYFLIKVINLVFEEIKNGNLEFSGFYPEWHKPTKRLINGLIIMITVMAITPYLPGFNSPAIKGITIFIGALISLGSSGTISNLLAGIVLIYTRSFRLGDYIKINDIRGEVIATNMLVTRLMTFHKEVITFSNTQILSSQVTNYNMGINNKTQGVLLNVTITLGYDVPWRKIYSTLIKAALKTTEILAQPEPFIIQEGFDDSYVSYTLNAYTKNPNKMMYIYSHLYENIQDCCNEAGIEILSPEYLQLRDGNHTTIPDAYLAKDYQSSQFQVKFKKSIE
ncbi:mechanosensitive ion channel family protein [Crocosphaera sp. UHCC 0190]|uniref:mechanosensitive ion channel family protein n=1 Tax=Crocosphaera sp. UHCC 0190 TaxID=3110246 RepID=UPI002B203519|nr:mechanosensitive ion channel family protein [Crocosphaera sp. UHCC 0190]MEA5511396.1 mechanosensitive ion channel family protein [Crocosphaera sp. UHCC 0190]